MTPSIPPQPMSWLTTIDNIALRQHREPLAFFEDVEDKGIWHFLWPARLLAILAVIILLRNATTVGYADWIRAAARLMTVTLILQLVLCGFLILLTQTVRFWFLYLFSPLLLAVLLLCSFGDLTPIALVLGCLIALPFAQGVLLADALALGFYKWAKHVHSKRENQRNGGPAADLPTLKQWGYVRLIRLALALLLLAGAIATPLLLLSGQSAFGWSAVLLFAAAGCTHVDATLLAYFGKWPLVSYDTKGEAWRATYIARHALFVPLKLVTQTITPVYSAEEASTALMALLREGCLGPQVRQACAQMQEQHLSSLLLHLSLHEGGAEAIRFLDPALPQALRQTAEHYANLATEAAKPLDLQRWLDLLPSKPDDSATTTPPHISQTLFHVRQALLEVEYTPIVEQANQEIEGVVKRLLDVKTTEVDLPLNWPVALLRHLEEQRRLLHPSSTSSVTSAPSPNDDQ